MTYKSKSTSIYYDALGLELKQARLKQGLTIAEVGEAVGHSSGQFISNIERSKAPLPLNLLIELQKLYKLDSRKIIEASVQAYKQKLTNEAKIQIKQ